MSGKKLSARLSVLFVMCVFAIAAKAMTAQPAYMDGGMGFIIQLDKTGDKVDKLNGGGPAELQTAIFKDPKMTPAGFEGETPTYKQGVFKDADGKRFLRYRSASGIPGDVYLSDIEKIKIKTADGVTLGKGEIEQLESYTSLKYVDLENCAFKNEIKNSDASNPLAGLSKRSSTLETIVFPVADGMIIPENVFSKQDNGTQRFPNLHTVIIPDYGQPTISTSEGGSTTTPKYYIANNAFKGSDLERVSLGYGFSDKKGDDEVGTMMFSHCESLKTVVLNNYIPSLPQQAFEYTYSLEYVDLPMYLSHIGDMCFKWSGLRTVTIPDYIEITGDSSPQIFQYCLNLLDIYVNTDNVKVKNQALFEEDQTKITYTGNGTDQWGYEYYQNNSGSSPYDGAPSPNINTFGEGSRTGQVATVLHYPGTLTSRKNYRVPCMFYYHGVDPATGTTWPTNSDFSNIYNGWNDPDGNYQAGYQDAAHGYANLIQDPNYGGWRQFKLGSQNIKEQDVFYEDRIKEARWYTVCYPMDLTKAQFESAYGIGADLRVFSSATYNADKNAVVLNFDQHETEDADGIYLKRNVPYMVHPARLNYREEKVLNRKTDPNTGEFIGYEYVKETIYINGVAYERDKSQQVLAFYNIQSDLFAKKNADGSDDEKAIQDAIDASESKLNDKMVWQHCDGVEQNMDFTYRGNYQKPGGSYAKTIPAGAFYLGMWPGDPKTLGFYKSDGSVSWPQYVAAILPGTKTDNTSGSSASQGDAGAKLDVSFFGDDVVDVTTEINNAPQIQINIIKTSDKVYNMNGQMVLDSAKDMKSLPKGIYIVNGRKIAVK